MAGGGVQVTRPSLWFSPLDHRSDDPLSAFERTSPGYFTFHSVQLSPAEGSHKSVSETPGIVKSRVPNPGPTAGKGEKGRFGAQALGFISTSGRTRQQQLTRGSSLMFQLQVKCLQASSQCYPAPSQTTHCTFSRLKCHKLQAVQSAPRNQTVLTVKNLRHHSL